MGIMIKGVLALFWLALIPMGAGIPMFGKKQDRGFGEYILSGYLVLFSITEIFTLAATWFHLPLHVLSTAYGITGVQKETATFPEKKICGYFHIYVAGRYSYTGTGRYVFCHGTYGCG